MAAPGGVPQSYFFDGLIDEIKIYNRPLTAGEIQAIFAADSTGPCGAPMAHAGPDQTVHAGEVVILDGARSYDMDGEPLTYQWVQTAGPAVTLDLSHPVHPTFATADMPVGETTLTFQLVVGNGALTSQADVVNVTVSNPLCYAMPVGITNWWPGDGGALDRIGHDHGVLQGGTTETAGKVGQAWHFDGTDDFVMVPLDTGVLTSWSVEFWMQAHRFTNPYYMGAVSLKDQWHIYTTQGSGGFGIYGLFGGLDPRFTYPTLQVDRWYHYAVTYDGTTLNQYVNGLLLRTDTTPSASSHHFNEIWFGKTMAAPGGVPQSYFFDGLIDEVKLYHRPLTAAEIVTIFQAGSAGACWNTPPSANAGEDQVVDENTLVTLDGRSSSDPEGTPLTYLWTQIAGPGVGLDERDPARPTFVAPQVAIGGATLTFQLIVSDGELLSPPAIVNITVKNINHPPSADAGTDQVVREGSLVILDGSGSFDPDAEPLSYHWHQVAGPTLILYDPLLMQAYAYAPFIGAESVTLVFALTVSDGMASAQDTVTVIVENVNHPPSAQAGLDQTWYEGTEVTLNGSDSSDPDGDPLTYHWQQVAGPEVVLTTPEGPMPSFVAPPVSSGGATLVFQLVVDDGLTSSPPDEVSITVLDRNDPPLCTGVQASPALLWPPDHKLVAVQLVGITDPNQDQVTVTITQVTQDEPVNGVADGNTSPDALIVDNNLLIRAERAEGGNGRVYQVSFRAEDVSGGSCVGSVTVCVPSRRRVDLCSDDGQHFVALQP